MSKTTTLEKELSTKEFIQSISEDSNRIVFQLHGDPTYVYRSFPLNGERPPMTAILDFLASQFTRRLKYVYGYHGEKIRISCADYVK